MPSRTGQTDKSPQVIPVAVGLLNPNGDEVVPTTVLEMTEQEQSFTFDGLASRPVASILRNFSAPVNLDRKLSTSERAFLLAHDTDPFNKWEAGRTLAKDILIRQVSGENADPSVLTDALAPVVADTGIDPAFRALVLALPGEDDLAQTMADMGRVADPLAIHKARKALRHRIAEALEPTLADLYEAMLTSGPYRPDAGDAGKRALRLAALALLTTCDGGIRANSVFQTADNMTEQYAALSDLIGTKYGADAIASFYDQWKSERLVVDKWFLIQPARSNWEDALSVAQNLSAHPDFQGANPNRWRALINGLVNMNPAGFHRVDGAAYTWFADQLLALDQKNPQVAARAATFFGTWKRYDADRQDMMRHELARMAATKGLSRNSQEIVQKLLGD